MAFAAFRQLRVAGQVADRAGLGHRRPEQERDERADLGLQQAAPKQPHVLASGKGAKYVASTDYLRGDVLKTLGTARGMLRDAPVL